MFTTSILNKCMFTVFLNMHYNGDSLRAKAAAFTMNALKCFVSAWNKHVYKCFRVSHHPRSNRNNTFSTTCVFVHRDLWASFQQHSLYNELWACCNTSCGAWLGCSLAKMLGWLLPGVTQSTPAQKWFKNAQPAYWNALVQKGSYPILPYPIQSSLIQSKLTLSTPILSSPANPIRSKAIHEWTSPEWPLPDSCPMPQTPLPGDSLSPSGGSVCIYVYIIHIYI